MPPPLLLLLSCFLAQVIAFDKFCAAIQRDVNNILAMHDNSQCSVCAQHRGGWGSTGGLVPVVHGLTAAQPPASPVASTGAPKVTLGSNASTRVSIGSNASGGQSHQRVLAGVGPELPATATNGTVEAAVAAQSRSSLHLQMDALSAQQDLQQQLQAQAAAQLQSQLQQQQQEPAVAVVGVRPSDSKTCLLSEGLSHSHRE